MRSLNYSLLVVCVFLSLKVYAQKTISGTVFNKKTGAALPYATITFISERVGVSADVNGRFKLVSAKTISNDTLLIKGVGYLPLKIAADKIAGVLNISLEEDVAMLKEINISVSGKEKLLGDYTKVPFTYIGDSGGQFARRFEKSELYHLLKDVIVSRNPSYLGSNTKTKFRIKVYDLDSITRAPRESLCMEIIEVEDLSNAEIKIDVSKYNISIPGKYFFVAVEYLTIPYNERYRLERESKIEYGEPAPAYYEVVYQPILLVGGYKNANSWYLAPGQGVEWKKTGFFPSIKVTVR